MDAGPECKAANAGEAMPESKVKLPPILRLPWPEEDSLHPYAHKNYLQFVVEILEADPAIYLTTEDDLRLFLSDREYSRLEACEQEIKGWLQKCCSGNDEIALKVYPYHSPFDAMWDLKKLLKEVAKRKVEKANQEAEEKERQAREEAEKKKRLTALEEINPPLDDAEKHLNKEEQEKFLDTIPGAIDAYLGRDKTAESYYRGIWLLNSKASDYSYWTLVIKERKQKEARKKQAQIEYDEYVDRLTRTVEKFKAELAKSKKPKFSYPGQLQNYEPDGWCDLELPSKQQIQNWAEGKILERLPQILVNLTKWELTSKVWVLPRAAYQASDVPCLRWHFDGHVLVTAALELKACVIRKHRPEGYWVEVQAQGEKLGTIHLGPREWLIPGTFTTPVAFLRLLAEGGQEAPGISVTEHWPPFTTFAIQGFEEMVEVSDDFIGFIRDISKEKTLVQALLDMEVIDMDTAKLTEAKWNLPLPPVSGSSAGGKESTEGEGDVVATLETMGFKKTKIEAAIGAVKFSPGMSLEEKVKTIVKNIAP